MSTRPPSVLAERAPDLADAIGDARIAARNAGIAAQRVGVLADSTNRLVNEQGKPAAEDLRKAIASVQRAADNLDAMIADARPGIQNFTKSTLPEANRLVRDLRDLSRSLQPVLRAARTRRASAARSARETARLQAGKDANDAPHIALLRRRRWRVAARSAACFGGGKAPPTLLTLTREAPAPASDRAHRRRRARR